MKSKYCHVSQERGCGSFKHRQWPIYLAGHQRANWQTLISLAPRFILDFQGGLIDRHRPIGQRNVWHQWQPSWLITKQQLICTVMVSKPPRIDKQIVIGPTRGQVPWKSVRTGGGPDAYAWANKTWAHISIWFPGYNIPSPRPMILSASKTE